MSKAILVMDMPSCCDERFGLDDRGDYPFCLITQEQRGYTFRTREQKMDKCPLKDQPKKREIFKNYSGYLNGIDYGWNACIDEILGE